MTFNADLFGNAFHESQEYADLMDHAYAMEDARIDLSKFNKFFCNWWSVCYPIWRKVNPDEPIQTALLKLKKTWEGMKASEKELW